MSQQRSLPYYRPASQGGGVSSRPSNQIHFSQQQEPMPLAAHFQMSNMVPFQTPAAVGFGRSFSQAHSLSQRQGLSQVKTLSKGASIPINMHNNIIGSQSFSQRPASSPAVTCSQGQCLKMSFQL